MPPRANRGDEAQIDMTRDGLRFIIDEDRPMFDRAARVKLQCVNPA
jgi:hypothetical protein